MFAHVDLSQSNSIPFTRDFVFNHVILTLAVSLDLKAFKKINAYHTFGWKNIPSHILVINFYIFLKPFYR